MGKDIKLSSGRVLVGDCLVRLADLADASVDSIVTDPPYELGFMGKQWDASGIAYQVDLWEQCLRVLKPGGHMLAFGGTRTYHRMACAIEDAGFEVRDCLSWLYGSGFPKSLNVGKAIDKVNGEARRWEGWGTALKPAHEPIVVARKPLIGTVAANVLAHGTGGLNIDGSRVGTEAITINGQGNDNFFHGNFSGKIDNPNRVGRWPANIVLDGAAAAALDQQNEGAARYFTQADFGPQDWPFVYQAKPSKAERNAGTEHLAARSGKVHGPSPHNLQPGESTGTWTGTNFHPTVKPVALMRHLVRLVTPAGGTVLDPFLGSGTTAVAATLEGFNWIGCEMTDDYLPIIKGRVAWSESEVAAGRADKPQYKTPTPKKPKPQQPTLEDGQQQ